MMHAPDVEVWLLNSFHYVKCRYSECRGALNRAIKGLNPAADIGRYKFAKNCKKVWRIPPPPSRNVAVEEKD